jgi:mannose-6-phosphate isomerase-like protein (cupin superfamily)
MAVSEAPLRSTRFGLAPDGEGWFVINAAETRWRDYGPLGVACDFEGNRPFKQLGININVLDPGEPLSMYHHEAHEEGFLVLAGECLLIVEGRERSLTAWTSSIALAGRHTRSSVQATDLRSCSRSVPAAGGRGSCTWPSWLP